MSTLKKIAILVISLGLLVCCNSLKSVRNALLKTSPYEEYIQSLEKSGLKETSMGKEWIEAGKQAFRDSIMVSLPFTESGLFAAAEPQARGYRFQVRAGQVLTISGQKKSNNKAKLFADLFVWKEGKWEELIHADSTLFLQQEFNNAQLCLLRLQPELLTDVWYSVTISLQPALLNPVQGATNKSIGSFYGNSRDNGARSHEGIDIFAPRGTPVIAPANGVVYSAGTNNLGGKVIWLYDPQRGQTYYFAHLDSQWVGASFRIKKGDTLGQVGNTGNAIHTAPHLHFGIYRSGSKDPLYYVQTQPSIIGAKPDTNFRSTVYRIGPKEAKLYAGPTLKAPVKTERKDTYVKLLAKTYDWYRVAMPDKQQAYMRSADIKPADKGRKITLKISDTLWTEAALPKLPVTILPEREPLELLAQYQGYGYVKTPGNLLGWIKLNDL